MLNRHNNAYLELVEGERPPRPEDLRPHPMRDKRALERARNIVKDWGEVIAQPSTDSVRTR